ncbi:MAG: hypothetical protein A2639_01775 [Candidatus Staskawiczbacteria bacterium RIFCSPHIGHO2_01_FULL_34_27]|uniref:histidine kinase n=2 Tax=Candidatus Staskawicziibacteriota TaxID=1817916 RepID=A0A1G2HNB1_9BACT|nr:MAG: hypothetical protein UR31_C0011G0001 [Parcubacteria group bacterium GW2011_GWA2_33_14]OGZ63378.1 MAG: hypothetical protein A2639_01775 [Candidatus Staskawiczbacteria bacterium RIFCSPHIGHO2_01_FULL_34_27]OGZ65861.1 MAG: hypothetical protein A3D34_03385 [Candidatus Staskawiczbacteria bacterium RIFCSPHIGHO2_02_FULL_33_16]OGZ70517.1 MAG: hypothetical protein A2980_01025 [Candidatus Staskawiczbacteria bacterium RIFCSPLOWO2_01_FULL_33_13]
MFGFGQRKKITEKLYQQNLELAVTNKTLSLLEELYQKSTLTLTPEEMAQEIANVICKDLNLELAGILIFKKESDSLVPLAFSKSERLVKTLQKLGFFFRDITIPNISKSNFLKKVVYEKTENITDDLYEVFGDLILKDHLKEVKLQSHIKTILMYPLIKSGEVLGVLILAFNRNYNNLNSFEKASIRSFINAIALLLDKAYLYKDLQDSYEVTKKAYALEKQAKKEIEKLDKFKDQFLMTTQHNLRTPLTSMMGYSDLLLNGTFGKQNKKTTEVIKKFQTLTQGMIKMVNDFLDMAQFELGKSVVVLKPGVELLPILDEIMGELAFKSETKGVYLKFQKPKKNILINADREKLKAALFNIVDNSVKYTVKGGVDIKLEYNSGVKIIVSDTGIGISEEKMHSLFDSMFERGDEAKKVSTIGSGVGLYLSNKIIKFHNGKLWVESGGEGKGSVFYIELPIK